MVIFNDLRLSDDKKCLIVDCEIEDVDGYDGMYIDSINVIYYKYAPDSSSCWPSAAAQEHFANLYEKEDEGEELTHIRVSKSIEDIIREVGEAAFGTSTLDGGLFVVYVKCDGDPANGLTLEAYGCGADRDWDLGIILDWKRIYEQGIAFAAKLATNCGNPCEDNSGFEQFILHWYGLQLAIATCDLFQVKKLWPKFMRISGMIGASGATLNSGCGCGR